MKLEKICHISSGGTPSRGKSHFYGGNIPWAKISDIENSVNGILTETEEKITEEGLKSNCLVVIMPVRENGCHY